MNAQQKRRQRFIEEFPIDRNGTRAAIRAGFGRRGAHVTASRLLKDPKVKAAIDERVRKMSEATQITAQAVLERWWQLATADAGELSQIRHTACRHCYGESHAYQWRDEAEWMAALTAAEEEGDYTPITADGGFGFRRDAPPHPDCPRCEGEGVMDVWFADSRELTPAARALFDGVKKTKDGVEVKTQDRAHALLQVAKHLGMLTERVDVTTPPPVGNVTPDMVAALVTALTD